MQFLYPDQIAYWYERSLKISGYSMLNEQVKKLWVSFVKDGDQCLPPGFLGRFLELWMSIESGPARKNAQIMDVEKKYLRTIKELPGSEKIEGVFLLSGADKNIEIATPLIRQILTRLPPLHSSAIALSDSDIDKSFSVEPNPPGFEVQATLESMYSNALTELEESNFCFYTDDIFEISHPNLFKKPADRFFYRRMARVMKGLVNWTKSVFTLNEESAFVVAKYGEPEVLPLGGYDEITTKGNISSLIPSELGYIDETMDFDLFDYKFLENQLMYYKRDSGAVFKIRRDVIVHVELTEFFEHERHLALLFAWSFFFAEKIVDTFVKDLVNVHILFEKYRPSGLKDACNFFKHFLKERHLSNRVTLNTTTDALNQNIRKNSQIWWFSPEYKEDCCFIETVFPQTDEFANQDPDLQEMELGEMINDLVESMVRYEGS